MAPPSEQIQNYFIRGAFWYIFCNNLIATFIEEDVFSFLLIRHLFINGYRWRHQTITAQTIRLGDHFDTFTLLICNVVSLQILIRSKFTDRHVYRQT